MGLDMYLYAETTVSDIPFGVVDDPDEGGHYVSGYEFNNDSEKAEYAALTRTTGITPAEDSPHALVVARDDEFLVRTCVAYWRKANAIHAWFVRECQDGVDECQVSDPISREKLTELRDIAQRVIDTADDTGRVNAEVAQTLLEPQNGFFFGGTDYDEWYVADLKSTVEQIDAALTLPDVTAFRYRSSW